MDVATAAEGEIEAAMARHLLAHVVEERQPGRDLDSPPPFDNDLRRQLRLFALTYDIRRSIQGAPPPQARGRSVLRAPRAAPSHREASRDRRGSGSGRCCA